MPGPLYGPDFGPGSNPTQSGGYDWMGLLSGLLSSIGQGAQSLYQQQKQPQQRQQTWGDPNTVPWAVDPGGMGQQPQMPMPQIDWGQIIAMLEQMQMQQAGETEEEEKKKNPAVEAAESQQGTFDLIKMLSQGGFGGGM